MITHSLMSRTLHYSKDGSKKYVTCQVQPSRFLYELVPSKKKVDGILEGTDIDDEPFIKDNEGTIWNRNAGVKEYVAGQNVPGKNAIVFWSGIKSHHQKLTSIFSFVEYFQKAYWQPINSVAKRADLRRHTSVNTTFPSENKIDNQATDNMLFKVGESVVVTNTKHKHYDKTGIVCKVSKCFVSFRESETRQIVRIKPSFLSMAVAEKDQLSVHASSPKKIVAEEKRNVSNGLSQHETKRLEARLTLLTVQQLKSRLKRLKLPVSGRKSQLISRLLGR